MPTYTAPVRETRFILEQRARHRPLFEPAGLRQCHARPGRGDPRGGGQVRRRGAAAAEPRSATRTAASATTTARSPRRPASRRPIEQFVEAGWPTLTGARGIWRAGPAAGRRHRGHRIYPLGQPQLRNVPGPDRGRDRLAAGQGQRTSSSRNTCPTWSPANGPAR